MSPTVLPPLVTPVIDYEPPAIGEPAPALAAARSRPCRAVPPPPRTEASARDAARFADAALRRVLEVIDRRRGPAQLRPLLASGLVDSLPGAPPAALGGARLRRVRAQPVSQDAAEIAASYSRGERVHAIAGRVQRTSTPAGVRWQLVALHMG